MVSEAAAVEGAASEEDSALSFPLSPMETSGSYSKIKSRVNKAISRGFLTN